MRAMVVKGSGKPMSLEERAIPRPGPGEIRLRVHACGICHSDQLVRDGLWPGLQHPRVPGHEVAGVVDAVGAGVTTPSIGDRIGVGWHGGHDGTCGPCMSGKFIHCVNEKITGVSIDGGYADYLVVPAVAAARMPDGLSFVEAAPLVCAGVTTFNALRNAGARSGDLVAVSGLGGLGHLGVQFARAMGFEVAAVSRGRDKEALARELGAHHYIDAAAGDPAVALGALGGARVILATAPHAPSISALVAGLGIEGCLLLVAAPSQPITVSGFDLIGRRARVQGWASGTAADSTDAMAFAARTGIRPMVEVFPLEEAEAGYQHMLSGAVRFRCVLSVAE